MSQEDPSDAKRQAQRLNQRFPGTMMEHLGIHMVEVGNGRALAEMSFHEGLKQLTGLFHAGAILALADTAATAVCLEVLGATEGGDRFPLAIQVNANLVRNSAQGKLLAEARPVHSGRTTMVVETSVRDEAGKLYALVTTTHLVVEQTPQQG